MTFFIYKKMLENEINNSEEVTKQIKEEFVNHPNWRTSEKELRDLRQAVYFALLSEEDDIDKAANLIDDLFNQLFITFKL